MARGRVFKKPSGTYALRVDVGDDPATGKRRQFQRSGYRTKKEAEAALDEILTELRSGRGASRGSLTLGGYLDEWIPLQHQRLKQTTAASYATAVKRIQPALGKRKLDALTPLEIETFYSELATGDEPAVRPLGAKTIRNIHVVLRKALADAERLGLVPRNAAAAAKPPVAHRKERPTWSTDNLREFLAFVAKDRFLPAYVLFATTGMRRGEVLGLRWSDVDLDNQRIAIVNTLTTINYKPVMSGPKTKRSRRQIYLDQATVEMLAQQRRSQQIERKAAGDDWSNHVDLVFRDELGRPVHPDWFSREFARQVRLSDLPRIRLHDLRHTYATLALKAGVHPKIVSERLGHATIGVTLDLYSHVTPAIARDAADAVADLILPGPN